MTKDESNESPRNFGVFLANVDDGRLVADLSDELHALVGTLETNASTNGKAKGEIVIKLKLSVDARGRVDVAPDVAVKSPKPSRGTSVFWVTRGGNLTNKNPKQVELPLRDVSAQREPAREVPSDPKDARSV